MTSLKSGNILRIQAGRPLRCWLPALLSGWVVMIFLSSVLIVVRDVPNAMTRTGVGSPGWVAATFRVADEMAPAAKLLFVALFAMMLWFGERWLSARMVETQKWRSFLRDIAMAVIAMVLTLALVPADLSRGFGIGLTGARFDPAVLPLYLASAVLAAVAYTSSVGRCRRAHLPSGASSRAATVLIMLLLPIACRSGAQPGNAVAVASTSGNPQATRPLDTLPPAVRVSAQPSSGFSSSYYVYVPPILLSDSARQRTRSILVMPNNTGADTDDAEVHDARVRDIIPYYRGVAARLGVVVLMPAFPRPKSDAMTYTHALDRDAMLTRDRALQRLDLQLLAMVDDARRRLAARGSNIESRMLMHGHSAAGMFVNRFIMLHPERVKAATIGAPGGWPIAPVGTFDGQSLRYPVGVGDLATIAGRAFDSATVARVPQLYFLGARDENDSVPYDDSYEAVDRAVILRLFGRTPLERWQRAEALYRRAIPTVEWRTYPDVGHEITRAMWSDIWAFLGRHAAGRVGE